LATLIVDLKYPIKFNFNPWLEIDERRWSTMI